MLAELATSDPDYENIETNLATLKSLITTTDMAFFNTQKVIDIFLSDIVTQATFSLPVFETVIVVLCILAHVYVHWISDDPTKISSNDWSRVAVPITSALSVKALDSARKIWNDYQKSLDTKLQIWKAKLEDSTVKYNTSFLLACAFIAKSHTSEDAIKAKLHEIFSNAHDFSSVDQLLP